MNYKNILKTFFSYFICIVLINSFTNTYKNNVLLYTILQLIFLTITLFIILKINKIKLKSIKKLSKKDYLTYNLFYIYNIINVIILFYF